MVYVPNEDVREQHPDESRYVKMFQSIDMRSNFYFSYSYDVTNTLQQNAQDPSVLSYGHRSVPFDDLFKRRELRPPAELSYVPEPVSRFMWNEFLLKPVYEQDEAISQEWILPVIHGFVDQANISIYGKPVYLTLIARRSNRFAGTRFLKRGANFRVRHFIPYLTGFELPNISQVNPLRFQGDVANEVETEQIVGDASMSDLKLTDMTSFVQIRGSFPGHWSQDTKTRLAKPPIYFQLQVHFITVVEKTWLLEICYLFLAGPFRAHVGQTLRPSPEEVWIADCGHESGEEEREATAARGSHRR